MLKNVTDADFQRIVLENQLPVMVDFWSTHCGPCRTLSSTLEELSNEYEGRVDIVKYNVEENFEKTNYYGIRSVPTLMLFKNGEFVKSTVGGLGKDAVRDLINEVL